MLNKIVSDNELGNIHYNVYISSTHDGAKTYALYFTLLGYQGFYRFENGANLETEEFAFEAMNDVEDMIIFASQLKN